MSFKVTDNSLPAGSLASLHLLADNKPAAKDSPNGFLAYIEHIFTVFWNAIKNLIAQIQAFFQGAAKPETENPLKGKTIKVENELPKQQVKESEPVPQKQQQVNVKIDPAVPQEKPAPQIQGLNQVATNLDSQKTGSIQERIKALVAQLPDNNANTTPVKQPVQDQPKVVEAPLPQATGLTAYEREHRIRKGAEDIQARLDREWQHAQNQMAREPNKAFVYKEADKNFVEAEEQRIGNYQIGLCHFQGKRQNMEDEHLAGTFNLLIAGTNYEVPLFAIMDGHSGRRCARFVRDNLMQTLNNTLIEFNPQGLTDEGIWNALKHTCVRLHEQFCAQFFNGKEDFEQDVSGTTAVFSMILDGKLWTANVGDSRAILNNNGKASQLSEDAKPANPNDPDPEITRYNRGIINRGGTIEQVYFWRINGNLACGRSIGDPHMNGANSSRPKITVRSLSSFGPNSFLILGCDGIFDVSSTQQIVDTVHNHRDLELGSLARNIVYSTEHSGSTDNESLMIVKLT